MINMNIGFIGTGKMATALVGAIINGKVTSADKIICSDPDKTTLANITDQYGVSTSDNVLEIMEKCQYIFLAFKPQGFPGAIAPIQSSIGKHHIFISILAGININNLQSHLAPGRIIRVMPNIPCQIGEMAAGYSAGDGLTNQEGEKIQTMLNAAGMAIEVEENLIDAVTGVSGSGPAFVAHLIDYYIQGGIAAGLPEDIARKLTLQTFLGTVKLLDQWDMTPEALINMVSSPNGTTVAGRAILEASKAKEGITGAIEGATKRSIALGNARE
jgi:pyrroline-5-carboxylate reductase